MNKQNVEDIYPLSPLQQGMLFHSLSVPGSYTEQMVLTLEGELQVPEFAAAWQAAIDRHPVLRSAFVWEGLPKPLQVVQRRAELPWAEHDLRDLDAAAQQERVRAHLEEERARGFELGRAPLVRLAVFRTGDSERRLAISFHHMLLDGWSLPIVLQEVLLDYQGHVLGRVVEIPRPRPFRDYIAWIGRSDAAQAEAFWRDALAGFREPTELGFAPADTSGGVEHVAAETVLPPETAERIAEVARRLKVTTNAVLRAAWAVLLSRYGGRDDVVFGSTVAGRPADLEGVERMVGMFINTIPVRVRVDGDRPVAELLRETHEHAVEARAWEHTPLVDVQGWSEVPRGAPLFESLLVYENMPISPRTDGVRVEDGEPVDTSRAAVLGSLRLTDVYAPQRTNYPVSVVVRPDAEGLVVQLTHDARRLDRAAADRMRRHLATLLEAIAADPDRPVRELPMLSEEERREALEAAAGPALDVPAGLTVHGMWEAQAAATPERTALVHAGRRVSYAELEARANRVAHRLRALGVGPETRVGVMMERTPDLVAALLGVLKAGGAYVPVDPAYPAGRVAYLLDDAGARVVVASPSAAERAAGTGAEVLLLDDAALEGMPEDAPEAGVDPANLSWVIYTSGSTGLPKGVQVEHRNAVTLLHWYRGETSAEDRAAHLGSTSVSFDVSVAELFGTLCWGGTLHLVENALAVADLPADADIRMASMVPSAAAELLRAGALPESLRTLNLGGEALPAHLARALHEAGVDRVVNLYGPTEDTTYSSWSVVPPDVERVAVGRAVANTRMYVLDAQMRPVPAGVPGEVWIAGDGVTRGYLGRPAMTAERYLPDPFAEAPGGRMYRVGDRARRREDGEVEYLGRLDHQVKVRGHRIEPGEVEAVLAAHPDVADAVAGARADVSDVARLVAWVTPAAGASPEPDALRAWLRERLPAHMVPTVVAVLDELPRTPNGKVDRAALPDPGLGAEAAPYAPPGNETEERIAAVWQEVLGVERVGVHDSFFDLGGHSLLLMQVHARLRGTLEREVAIVDLFQHPTVRALADHVRGGGEADAGAVRGREVAARRVTAAGEPTPETSDESTTATMTQPAAPASTTPPADAGAEESQVFPTSFAQARLWFLDRLDPGSPLFAMPIPVRVEGPLDRAALQGALERIVARHETLRTVFATSGGDPVQVVLPAGAVELPLRDLSTLPAAEREDALQEALREEINQPFDLRRGPLFRPVLIRMDEEDHVIVLNMHHIVSDGWSLGVLMRELTALYDGLVRGEEPSLPPLPIQYADYSVWQREWLSGEELERQIAYWRDHLAEAPPILELPTDHPRPAVQTHRGAQEALDLSRETVDALSALGRREGATMFMVLLAAWKLVLSRHARADRVVVGTPIAGRTQEETEGLIGFFINTLPLHTDLSGDPTFLELLRRVRETTLGAFAHQDLPFEKLVEELKVERSLGHSAVFQVGFNLLNAPTLSGGAPLSGTRFAPVDTPVDTEKYDMTLGFGEHPDGGGLGLSYNPDLWEAGTIRRILAHLGRVLDAAAARPEERVSSIRMADDEEMELLRGWEHGVRTEVPALLLHRAFEAQVRRDPAAPALAWEGGSMTYGELDARANRLAHRLRDFGVGPEVPVAISLDRGAWMWVSVLAALKAGGAYVPVDPAYPEARRAFMLEDCGAPVVITDASYADDLAGGPARVLVADDAALEGMPETPPEVQADPDNLVWVIYTSGSTGRPKGVAVTHRGATNLLADRLRQCEIGPGDRLMQFAAFSFDASAVEWIKALGSGACMYLADREALLPGPALVDLLDRWEINHGHPSPALMAALPEATLPHFRHVDVGGEALPTDVARRWGSGRTLVNCYGPTEITVMCTSASVDGSRRPPIGRALDNVRLHVLDERMRRTPAGVPGELYVGGPGVSRGYLGRPGLTAAAYVPDPLGDEPGARLYRTGDLVRWLPDGQLDFLGRVDEQVKVRGFRIELGEIEAVLREHAAVAEAVAAVRSDDAGARIVAYVVPPVGVEAPDAAALRSHSAERLPEHAVPSIFAALDALPLTPSGKVDRRALPDVEASASAAYVPPSDALEETLVALWAELLGVERVGMDDNFFELGGHSLLLTRMQTRIRADLGREVPIVSLFRFPTVRTLAAHLREESASDGSAETAARGQARAEARRAARRDRRSRRGAR